MAGAAIGGYGDSLGFWVCSGSAAAAAPSTVRNREKHRAPPEPLRGEEKPVCLIQLRRHSFQVAGNDPTSASYSLTSRESGRKSRVAAAQPLGDRWRG